MEEQDKKGPEEHPGYGQGDPAEETREDRKRRKDRESAKKRLESMTPEQLEEWHARRKGARRRYNTKQARERRVIERALKQETSTTPTGQSTTPGTYVSRITDVSNTPTVQYQAMSVEDRGYGQSSPTRQTHQGLDVQFPNTSWSTIPDTLGSGIPDGDYELLDSSTTPTRESAMYQEMWSRLPNIVQSSPTSSISGSTISTITTGQIIHQGMEINISVCPRSTPGTPGSDTPGMEFRIILPDIVWSSPTPGTPGSDTPDIPTNPTYQAWLVHSQSPNSIEPGSTPSYGYYRLLDSSTITAEQTHLARLSNSQSPNSGRSASALGTSGSGTYEPLDLSTRSTTYKERLSNSQSPNSGRSASALGTSGVSNASGSGWSRR